MRASGRAGFVITNVCLSVRKITHERVTMDVDQTWYAWTKVGPPEVINFWCLSDSVLFHFP